MFEIYKRDMLSMMLTKIFRIYNEGGITIGRKSVKQFTPINDVVNKFSKGP